jgi:hypothetical protein
MESCHAGRDAVRDGGVGNGGRTIGMTWICPSPSLNMSRCRRPGIDRASTGRTGILTILVLSSRLSEAVALQSNAGAVITLFAFSCLVMK